ncbi:oligosaccharide flippase family protein [Psychrobium sp. 1_MG-2023]|uniref:oligosaccharide flippase family protein n=1 Tax=Psychrobium sp. 1_MG-2023 TaxID=3062624 RepID=UPI000C330D09|nr:oligosaccharide flippase family protein [Psychrobium sp. 1_MG-2023]MDP2562082.1 oligosaccharide flippase family protein [Psychrobium sp. 1_MG-2023]PKF55681.1 hypothetical protein CW748_12570 [Alteromonadales bacterium alter-6D02]
MKADSLMKVASWYTISRILVLTLSFISIPIFTHLLSPNEFGEFAIYTMWIAMLTPFVGLGLHMSIGRAKVEFKERYKQYVSSIVFLLLILLIIALVTLSTFESFFVGVINYPSHWLYLIIVQTFMSLFINTVFCMFQFNGMYKQLAIVTFLQMLVSLLLSIYFVNFFFEENKAEGRIFGVFFIDLILGCALCIYAFVYGRCYVNMKFWAFGIKYSTPFILGSLSYIINGQFDRLLINEYLGAAEAGIYSFSYSIGMLLLTLAIAVKQALNPWVYEQLDNGQKTPVKVVYKHYIIVFSLLAVIMLHATPELITLLSKESYWDGLSILPWIVLAAYIQVLILNESETQMFLKKTLVNSSVVVVGAILNIVLNYMFIPKYGSMGAVVTTVVTYAFMLVLLLLININVLHFKLVSNRVYLMSLIYILASTTIFFLVKDSLVMRFVLIIFNLSLLFLYYMKKKKTSQKALC